MEAVGVLLSVLCCFAILAGPAVLSAASTTEIPRADVARSSVQSSSQPKNTENQPDPCPWFHVGRAEVAVQPEGEFTRDSSRSKEKSVRDTRPSKHTGDPREDGVHRSTHQRGPAVDLSSHDITLPDSGAISARTARQAKRSVDNYPASSSSSSSSSSSVSNSPGDDVARRSIDSSGSDLKDDLGVAEDRYPPPNPYWYQRQYSNQRYRPNDRRDPYRNYLRYPVFSGR